MNTTQENLIVIRDKENKIVAVVSKYGTCTEIYETELAGYEDIAELFNKITNQDNINQSKIKKRLDILANNKVTP